MNRSIQRALKAVSVMVGRELDGITPGEIAAKTGMSASQVTITLANLQIAGWAVKSEKVDGRWRLTPLPVQMFGKVAESFEQARLRVMQKEAYYLNG